MKSPDNIEYLYGFELFILAFFMIASGFIVFMVIFSDEPIPQVSIEENISINKYGNK